MTTNEMLLKRLPLKYHNRFLKLEAESGLIEDCKYMLFLTNGYVWNEYPNIPVKSITEAIKFIKEAYFDEAEYEHFIKGDRF